MNKIYISLSSLFLGLFSAYYLISLEEKSLVASSASAKQVKKSQKKKVFKKSLRTSLIIDCLDEQSCDEKIKKQNLSKAQIHLKVSTKLENLILRDKYQEVSESDLLKIMREESRSSFVLANYILQKNGLSSKAFATAEQFHTKLIQEFLYTYSYPKILEKGNNRELRQKLILSYLSHRSKMQLVHTVGALNQISFKAHEVEEIRETFCRLRLPKKNEAQIALHSQFNNFLVKYKEQGC